MPMVERSPEDLRFWLKSDSEPPGAFKTLLLSRLLAHAGASLPNLGTAADLLRNALASVRRQKSLLLSGELKFHDSNVSSEAALLAMSIAEKQLDQLAQYAVIQAALDLDQLAHVDLGKLINAKINHGQQPQLAMDDILRSIRNAIESSAKSSPKVESVIGFSLGDLVGPMPVDEKLKELRERLERSLTTEKDDAISDGDFWSLAKEAALTELKADRLDSPETHTSYIRARINPVFDDVQS